MEFREQLAPTEQIKDVSFSIDDDVVTLKWKWPTGFEYAYVYKISGTGEVNIEDMEENKSRLYTRAEYANLNGYHEKINEVNLFTYAVFPCIYSGGKKLLVCQNGKDNQIVVATGRTNVYYSIITKKKMFSKRKFIQMEIKTDVPINRNVLCYVIKKDSYPINKDDGKIFPFPQDFIPGGKPLPEIEIDKDEFVRIFLTDGKKYGEIYNLLHV